MFNRYGFLVPFDVKPLLRLNSCVVWECLTYIVWISTRAILNLTEALSIEFRGLLSFILLT